MRSSGVLMHISSLSSPYGIGTMGRGAREFVDFLVEAGQKYWQILPVCPTSYGDSPYQSFSTFAGNPYFIDFEKLEADGLLLKSDYETVDWESTPDRVNYGALYEKCYPVLRIAANCFLENPSKEFDVFCDENKFWLDDYALFMMLKWKNNGLSWMEWDEPLKKHDEKALKEVSEKHKEEIIFWKVLQYFFLNSGGNFMNTRMERGLTLSEIFLFMWRLTVWMYGHIPNCSS